MWDAGSKIPACPSSSPVSMCITIPSSANVKRARQWVVWQWLTASPLRLLGSGAGAAFLAVLLLFYIAPPGLRNPWTSYNLLFGVIPWLLFGVIFELAPGRLKVTPPRYARYGLLFFVLLLSQLLFHLSSLTHAGVGIAYLLSLWLAWWLALSTMKGLLESSYQPDIGRFQWLYRLILLAGLSALVCGLWLVWG
jgi:hypothetical protein